MTMKRTTWVKGWPIDPATTPQGWCGFCGDSSKLKEWNSLARRFADVQAHVGPYLQGESHARPLAWWT